MKFTDAWAVVANDDGYLSVKQMGELLEENKAIWLRGSKGHIPLTMGPSFDMATEKKRELVKQKKQQGGEINDDSNKK